MRVRIRFKDKWCERHDAAYHFMPFKGITVPEEEPPLPVIEFQFGMVEGEEDVSLMVLLNRKMTQDELDELEDAISSYTEEVEAYTYDRLIRDLLEAAGVEYWIISPMRIYIM